MLAKQKLSQNSEKTVFCKKVLRETFFLFLFGNIGLQNYFLIARSMYNISYINMSQTIAVCLIFVELPIYIYLCFASFSVYESTDILTTLTTTLPLFRRQNKHSLRIHKLKIFKYLNNFIGYTYSFFSDLYIL